MSPRRRAGRPVAVSLLAVLTGCHSYVPVLQAPVPGTEVSVQLTDRGRVALTERIGPEVDLLRGTFVAGTDSIVSLSLTESVSVRGVAQGWSRETITIPRDALAGIRVRQLDKGRTALAVATAGVGVGLLLTFSLAGGGGFPSDGILPPSQGPGPSTRTAPLTHP